MRTIALVFIYCLLAVILIPVLLICYLGNWKEPIISISKAALQMGKKILGIKVEVYGKERIDKNTAYVFMANHLSFLDGPLLFMITPQNIRVILKKEVFRIPIVSQGMRLVGFIPVDRKRLKGGKKSIERASRMIKEKGFSFLIFPEGTRSRNGKLQLFRRGGFFLAVNTQAPIVPATIAGTYELMPRGSFFVRKGKVKVRFSSPLSVQGYDQTRMPQLMGKVWKTIRSGLED